MKNIAKPCIHELHKKIIYNEDVETFKLETVKFSRFREYVVVAIFALFTISIIIRLVYIDTVKVEFLNNALNNNVVRNIKLVEPRGDILDKNSIALAISTPVYSIFLNANEFKLNSSEKINEFQKLINSLRINIDLINVGKSTYIVRNISPKQNNLFSNLEIKGLYSFQSYKRFYPLSDSISNLIGRTNIDDDGIDGLEYSKNSYLKSIDGNKKISQNLKGEVIDYSIQKNPEVGKVLKLTINSSYQAYIYSQLKSQVISKNAARGAVIVLDAKNGDILAMASYPSINPNIPTSKNYIKYLDPTYQTVFDPGSIIKPLIISKAIDDKKITPQTIFDTKPIIVGNKTIKDDHPMNQMTVSKIVQYSSDIGTAKISMKYTPKEMYDFYKNLGFGVKTGLGLSGETKGILNSYKRWTPTDQALMSFGYGISINLLQIASSYTIFTNNGCYLKPHLYLDESRVACNPIINSSTSFMMDKILESTVTDGTGKGAKILNYSVAGKTGTAQKLEKGKYVNDKHIASFVGFAPVDSPKYIVAVMIDEPKNGYYAATTSAPLFQKIMTYLLNQ